MTVFNYKKQRISFVCCEGNAKFYTYLKIELNTWINFCLIIDQNKNEYKIVFNDQLKPLTGEVIQGLHVRGGGVFYIGQDQDNLDDLFDPNESLSGYMSDLIILAEALRDEAALSYAACESVSLPASKINFENVKNDFEVSQVKITFINTNTTFCTSSKVWKVFNVEKTFDDAVQLCQTTGGVLPAPASERENRRLFNFTQTFSAICDSITSFYYDKFWIGARGSENGQNLENYNTGHNLSYTNLVNDDEIDNTELGVCVSFYGCKKKSVNWHGKWQARRCSHKRNVICEYKNFATFKLRGLCSESYFDHEYYLGGRDNDLEFIGTFFSSIKPNGNFTSQREWILTTKISSDTYAIMVSDMFSVYPIGLQKWKIKNDNCETEEQIKLKLTPCSQGEFTCNDGTCIDLELRCDTNVNCEDESDEQSCNIRKGQEGNLENIPPLPTTGKLKVDFFLTIISINSFDISKFTSSMDIKIILTWCDYRLVYKNLRVNSSLNVIPEEQFTFWMPSIDILNEKGSYANVIPRKNRIIIHRVGEPVLDDDKNIHEGKKKSWR